jgi:plastocyanin
MDSKLAILKNIFFYLCCILLATSCESSTETPVQESPGPGKNVNKKHTVEIREMKFQPAELMVQKGDTVVWINKDIVSHDVTEEAGKSWASSPLATGQSWSLIVTQGANYYCSLHVVMKGRLVMQ